LFGVASVSVAAQEIRIGFINTDRIFKEANTAKQAQAKLEQEFSKREKELNDFGASLKAGVENLSVKRPLWLNSSGSRAKAVG
jgi:outer membrane protein